MSSSGYGVQHSATDDSEKKEGVPRHPMVDGQRVYSSRIESRKLRIKTTGRDGVEKINARIPVRHLSFKCKYEWQFIMSITWIINRTLPEVALPINQKNKNKN